MSRSRKFLFTASYSISSPIAGETDSLSGSLPSARAPRCGLRMPCHTIHTVDRFQGCDSGWSVEKKRGISSYIGRTTPSTNRVTIASIKKLEPPAKSVIGSKSQMAIRSVEVITSFLIPRCLQHDVVCPGLWIVSFSHCLHKVLFPPSIPSQCLRASTKSYLAYRHFQSTSFSSSQRRLSSPVKATPSVAEKAKSTITGLLRKVIPASMVGAIAAESSNAVRLGKGPFRRPRKLENLRIRAKHGYSKANMALLQRQSTRRAKLNKKTTQNISIKEYSLKPKKLADLDAVERMKLKKEIRAKMDKEIKTTKATIAHVKDTVREVRL